MVEANDNGFRRAAVQFFDAVEAVFDSDWEYTRNMLGLATPAESRAARAELLAIFGEEPQPPIDTDDETFLRPCAVEQSVDNWGHYQNLLEAYVDFRALIGTDFADERFGVAAIHFFYAVEAVFDGDWWYTRLMVGVRTPDEKNVTFLRPCDFDRAVNNWRNYANLLETYVAFRDLVETDSVHKS